MLQIRCDWFEDRLSDSINWQPSSELYWLIKMLGYQFNMMTSSNGSIYRATGLSWGEFTSHPFTEASDAELWCFLLSDQTVAQTVETPEIWDAIRLILTSQ